MTEAQLAALKPGDFIVDPKIGTYVVILNDPIKREMAVSIKTHQEGTMEYSSLADATKL